MSRLLQKIRNHQVAIGSADTLGAPRLIEVMASSGLDMVSIDMMFCPTDWETIAAMIRAAQAFKMDVFVRVPAYPWVDRTDPRLVVDAVRALAVGATGIVASCATTEEVRQLLEASRDWHRDIHLHPVSHEDLAAFEDKAAAECVIMPLVESRSAIARLDEILALPGLTTLFLGLTDISRLLGHPFDYEHPLVNAFVTEAIAKAHEHGVALGGNVGYQYSTAADMTARVSRMVAQGFDFVWLQQNGFLIQRMYLTLLKELVVPTGGTFDAVRVTM